MKITICDHCHKEKKGAKFELNYFAVKVEEVNRYQVDNRDFCSLFCMQQYIINGMKGRGLDDHIVV